MMNDSYGDDGFMDNIPDNCWSPDKIEDVQNAIKRVTSERVYEDGKKKENGISQKFLNRLWAVEYYADIKKGSDPYVISAQEILGEDF
jgi:hypothetical protein